MVHEQEAEEEQEEEAEEEEEEKEEAEAEEEAEEEEEEEEGAALISPLLLPATPAAPGRLPISARGRLQQSTKGAPLGRWCPCPSSPSSRTGGCPCASGRTPPQAWRMCMAWRRVRCLVGSLVCISFKLICI